MRILIIEDDEEKSKKITDFLYAEFIVEEIKYANSFNSGLRALIAGISNTDIVLLDMSMPTYDISIDEPTGGIPESFAGKDLLAQMRLRALNIPTIVVTQFDSFGSDDNKVSLEKLSYELRSNYSPPFVGYVYYNSAHESWKSSLKTIILNNIKDKNENTNS